MRITKPFYYTIGWISLILGIIGAFLPVMPTAPFVILASLCFSNSSPRMHKWLTSIPHFGNAILEWENHRVVRPRVKITAVLMIWVSVCASLIFGQMQVFIKIILCLCALAVSVFLYTRNSYPKE